MVDRRKLKAKQFHTSWGKRTVELMVELIEKHGASVAVDSRDAQDLELRKLGMKAWLWDQKVRAAEVDAREREREANREAGL